MKPRWLCHFLVPLGLREGEGWFGHAAAFSKRRLQLPLEDAEGSEMQGKLHRCQLYCSKNILPFIALIFHSLLPEWRHMLGFCIRNWGRTDGRDAVGSNTVIKVIYTARNSQACVRRWVEPHGPSSFLFSPHGNYGVAQDFGRIRKFTFTYGFLCEYVSSSRAPKTRKGTDWW